MSDDAETAPRVTAGGLLRAAREKQGLHIAALAASIKVAPRKLDALEHDRYTELPDATFTRALAQTVCRSLKIDPQPVLALLPHAEVSALDHVSGMLNEPFRERPGRTDPGAMAVAAIRPMAWAGLLLLAAAAAVYFVPAGLFTASPEARPSAVVVPPVSEPAATASAALAAESATGPVPAASAVAQGDAAASSPRVETVFSAPPLDSAAAGPPPTTMVQLRADEASWVEVRDGRGQVLLSRTVQAGESVGFDGALPIRMTIGNAPATRVSFRGRPVDLAVSTRDSVARLELQ